MIITDSDQIDHSGYDDALARHAREVEWWTVIDGEITSSDLVTYGTAPEAWSAPLVDSSDLPYEAWCQVDRFNALMESSVDRLLWCAPETATLLSELHDACSDLVGEIRVLDGDVESAQRRHHLVSVLVEMTASFSIFCSQVLAGTLPVAYNTYPTGEYSLLGLGTSVRALLRLYQHISGVFDRANLCERIEASYVATGSSFEPFVTRLELDYSKWDSASVLPARLTECDPAEPGGHLTYYSARWGFRQAEHTLSVSWQCINAAASKQWNLLTLSHEFLHAHVTDLLNSALDWTDPSADVSTCASMAAEHFETAQDSMRAAVTAAMAHMLACSGGPARPELEEVGLLTRPTVPELRALRSSEYWIVQEIAVHTLDYQYFYDGDDYLYASSLWNSWALVPKVSENLEHYILRTLCAYSVHAPHGSSTDDAFSDAVGRLRAAFDSVLGERREADVPGGRNASSLDTGEVVVRAALEHLNDPEMLGVLEEQFHAASYISQLVNTFFYESHIHGVLMRDDQIASPNRRYDLSPGSYRTEPVNSPPAFLLDRFTHENPINGDGVSCEFETLWQAIALL